MNKNKILSNALQEYRVVLALDSLPTNELLLDKITECENYLDSNNTEVGNEYLSSNYMIFYPAIKARLTQNKDNIEDAKLESNERKLAKFREERKYLNECFSSLKKFSKLFI